MHRVVLHRVSKQCDCRALLSVGCHFLRAASLQEGRHNRPHDAVRLRLQALNIGVDIQQITDPFHCKLIIVIREWSKRVLKHIRGVCHVNERQRSLSYWWWTLKG